MTAWDFRHGNATKIDTRCGCKIIGLVLLLVSNEHDAADFVYLCFSHPHTEDDSRPERPPMSKPDEKTGGLIREDRRPSIRAIAELT